MGFCYEVQVDLATSAVAEWLDWIGPHAREVVASGGFDAAIIHADTASPGRYVIRYSATSVEHINRYLAEHAPRLRADALERFGDRMTASRRVLSEVTP